jgi:Ca2+-binding RTX toxin-like protein
MDSVAYQSGFTLSGSAPGATSVELKIGSKTIATRAYVNNKGMWSIQLASDQLPFANSSSKTTLQAVAINAYGAVSEIRQTDLLFDTANPSILSIANEGNKVRIVFDEFVRFPISPADSKFSVRSGSRSIGIKSLQGNTNSLGKTELVLELNETLPIHTVVRLSYFGNGITDEFGNKLPQFNNRIVTDLAISSSISQPGYAYANLLLAGNENLYVIGNAIDNTILGNSGDNILEGAGGSDVLTGGLGRDTFVFSGYRDSVLVDPVTGKSSIDKITDFAIGTDIIDGPSFVDNIDLLRVHSSESSPISSDLLQTLLPANILLPDKAAVLTFAANQRTFLVLNDKKSGYSPTEDVLIDITGYSGLIGNLNII